ncbi:MAG: thiol-disulfide oxidoreductase DCC family protein [Myxococcota bacterium]|nr:thiol-disulfide oxidoreductase DCC family protein [Myxococcota bacterium]
MASSPDTHPIVLFDGVCNLCSGAVQFIIDRDPEDAFRFASLQSERAAELLRARGRMPPEGDPESLVLIDGDEVYERSGAALRIARRLRAPWGLLYAFWIVPWFLRDALYRVIARNRYRWFGRSEQCRVPTPELRERFLG